MTTSIKKIIVLGGGSAGWLAAGLLAAEHGNASQNNVDVTLVESPDISPLGVGEGTWPSMRETLSRIGVKETDFFKECEVSFKQGAKFVKWVTGEQDDFYYHPLVLPHGFGQADLVGHWRRSGGSDAFADAVSVQAKVCENGLAPKQISTPEYASVINYAYHLNSNKLGQFLMRHCTAHLGVKHIIDHVVEVKLDDHGYIRSLGTNAHGKLEGDLFVDCSGMSSFLLGQHLGVPFVSLKDILFNDTAQAVHVPYPSNSSPIASHTISTAQSAGWIWDIGLPTRRGVGNVYSSSHISDEEAQRELRSYISASLGAERADALDVRKITFNPGHREKFWYKNCVAVGMSAGFLEPLEASALVLVESSVRMISEDMPVSKETMDIAARRFNKRFQYYWESIVDFLKLHYILTKRVDSQYWLDNKNPATIPDRLQERLLLWKEKVPNKYDFPMVEEMFPAASWQYVLYGMGFETRFSQQARTDDLAIKFYEENRAFMKKCLDALPSNRDLVEKIHKYGMQKI